MWELTGRRKAPPDDKLRAIAAVAATTAAALILTIGGAAADDPKYPNWKGQWSRYLVPGVGGQGAFDQTRLWGRGQQAPLTAEYQKVFEASMADQAKGGLGNYPPATCHPGGMPRMMYFGAQEYVITPEATYILLGGGVDQHRRIFTDGRDFPADIVPTYQGYSIGRWIDAEREGRYSALEVETRGPFKGPRAFDASGLPLHADNQSIFKERFHLDRADPGILHEEVTVIDHALTRPWSVDRRYIHNPDLRAQWPEGFCVESNVNVVIGAENYVRGADGLLMPTKKDQPPPDLRYFKPPQK
jgi:hypothetical protein